MHNKNVLDKIENKNKKIHYLHHVYRSTLSVLRHHKVGSYKRKCVCLKMLIYVSLLPLGMTLVAFAIYCVI